MKKSFMNNIKNFVDSNVRQRIDRVAHHYSEPLGDDLLLVERHFEDIRQVCLDADKRISVLLQSIQLSSHPSHLGAYTQNVQAGLNNLSQNLSLQAANIASSSSNNTITPAKSKPNENALRSSQQLAVSGDAKSSGNNTQQYRSSESLDGSNTLTNSNDSITSHPILESNCPPTQQLSDDIQQRYKKLPVVGFYKFLVKSSQKLKQDSLLAITLSQCSQIQIQLTNLYLTYERLIETQCLKPIQHMLETDIPNVIKLRKLYIKTHNDYEFLKTKYNGATLKQQQQQQSSQTSHFTNTSYLISQNSIQQTNTNKLDQLKNELDEAVARFEQARDTYEADLYGFVCRETELVKLLGMFYQHQTEYHLKVGNIMQGLMPALNDASALTLRKTAFGTQLPEHLRCTGREISPVIELCVHFLHLQGLKEEGLFRIPGSSVKIKKLRNGINAWFLSLASLEELASDQKQRSGQHCVDALYDLFKNTVGQRMHDSQTQQQASTATDGALKSTSAVDEMASNHANFPNECHISDEIILDVHSVAGLLKLYLRELPEPLCTFALYDEWIHCIDSKADNKSRLELMSAVIRKLPPAYRTNLRHLIKFLHHLTHHQELNKMTSTNLAITMAPSLIWSKSIEAGQCDSSADDAQALNMQMSTFGISASNHAMILEALINNAEELFPDSADFSLPGFENLKLFPSDSRRSKRSRSVKSISPTGLSTTSSSSFSSNASNSTASSAVRGHNRKGGSMEGLLGAQDVSALLQQNQFSSKTTGRPVSVQLQRDEYSASVRHYQKPPPKPPIPTTRSHSRQASCDEYPQQNTINTPLRTHNKPPAPPVPPPTSVRHQLERQKAASSTVTQDSGQAVVEQKPRPISLRGTGVIEQGGTTPSTNQLARRPTVPPPERPKSASNESNKFENEEAAAAEAAKARSVCKEGVEIVCQDATENECAASARTTSESRTNGPEDDGVDSQVVPLDSVSENDSSFDNDNESHHSLGQSWSKCSQSNGSPLEEAGPRTSLDGGRAELRPDSNSDTLRKIDFVKKSPTPESAGQGTKPPVKPPRSTSPKITQSTPL